MFRIHGILDETGCVLNKKMMPDLTVMVTELEIDRKKTTKYISKEKCEGPGAGIHGDRNSAIKKQPLTSILLVFLKAS
jgi:hypothetical protein